VGQIEDAVLVEETGAGKFQVRVRTGDHQFLADEPIPFGGLSSGPNPFDLVCAALASCTVMTMRLYAERKGWPVDRMSARVRHRKNSPEGTDLFERVLHLGDVTAEQRDRLLHIANRCPVHLMLERGAAVETRLAADELPPARGDGLHARIIETLCDEEG
jgi:putative redox protein